MKRWIALLLTVVTALSLLAGCGEKKTAGETPAQGADGAQQTQQTAAPGAEAGTDAAPVDTPVDTQAEPAAPAYADPYDAVKNYWKSEQLTQAWGPDQLVEHLFFHPIIAYPKFAFHESGASQAQRYGLDDWMCTVDEYNKILQSVYDRGYILVRMEDVWSEYTTESGAQRMKRNTLMLPEGKKPLVISFDDVNYYPYMLEEGFTSKLVIGDDGEVWAECKDPYTGEIFNTKELDATPILDQFVYEHPDFSLNGAKAIFSLTGYQGILGYRTQDDRDIAKDSPDRPAFEQYRAAEIEAVKPVIKRLKETGWTFGSHTWGHIRLSKPLQTVINDTERWEDEVGSLVGPTQILFYPHGGRPDGDDWHQTGPNFQYLQSKGFRVFASVGVNSFSYIKPDICAVICDRLHPDGTTLRHSRERYLQFYDAKDIMDVNVRPKDENHTIDW
ncbi:MAG: hydrolase [Oscillospiraceae bacterium]|nr:hydrolase [Oscillospiraceae bacterium]